MEAKSLVFLFTVHSVFQLAFTRNISRVTQNADILTILCVVFLLWKSETCSSQMLYQA